MSIEKTYYVPNDEYDEQGNKKTLIVKPGTYFCFECLNMQKIMFTEKELEPCECGSHVFFTT